MRRKSTPARLNNRYRTAGTYAGFAQDGAIRLNWQNLAATCAWRRSCDYDWARSSSAISILLIFIIAAIAFPAFCGSGLLNALPSAVGMICHERPNLSLS